MTSRTATFAVLCCLATVEVAGGQAPTAVRLEVASIRRNTTDQGAGGGVAGRRYTARNQRITGLLMAAYGLPPERILNAPSWTTTEAYDISVQADRDIASGDLQPLLRELLRERFNFISRSGTQEFPAYALTVARTDGNLGPGLRRTPIDCRDAAAVAKARAEAATGRPICGGSVRGTTLAMSGMSLNALAQALVSPTGRPVVNKTGLTGAFDIDLAWATMANPDGVSIFTAVQDQLGLKLETATASLPVLIVDRIDRPSEN